MVWSCCPGLCPALPSLSPDHSIQGSAQGSPLPCPPSPVLWLWSLPWMGGWLQPHSALPSPPKPAFLTPPLVPARPSRPYSLIPFSLQPQP